MTLMLVLAAFASGQLAEPTDILQKLRGPLEIVPGLTLTGPNASKHSDAGPEGLRINLPANREKLPPVGLQALGPIGGDFEITASYELLEAERPTKPLTFVGVNLFLDQRPHGKHIAKLGRHHGVRGQVYLAQVTDFGRAVGGTVLQQFPTEARAGELRLVRRGSELSYQVRDDTTGDTFRELMKGTMDAGDLHVVRFVVNSGEEPCGVDARLVEFRIRADGSANAPAPRGRRGLLVASFVITAILALGIGAWIYAGRRQLSRDTAAAGGAVRRD